MADGLVAGRQRLEPVGAVVQAQVGIEPDPHLLGQAVDQGERARRVLVHLQEALAAQRQQVRRADRLEAEEEGALRGRLGEVALAERFDSLAEGLLGAGREQDHAGRPRAAPRAKRRARASRETTAVPLSLAPGTTSRRPMSAIAATEPRPRKRPSLDEQAPAAQRAERRQQRAADDRRHQHRAGVGLLDQAEAVGDQRDLGMEDEAGVGGVVVGDDDDGALGLGVAELADDVVGGALGQQPGAGAAARAGSRRRCRRRRSPPARRRAARRPRSPASAPSAPRRGAEPERPPVGAVRRLGLDPRLGAELGEAADQPLGRPALALGGRRAVDLLQFLEPLAQPISSSGCHRAEKLPTYHGGMLGGGSFTLFHVRGIRISVDWSWFLILFFLIFCDVETSTNGCWASRAPRPRRSCWRC